MSHAVEHGIAYRNAHGLVYSHVHGDVHRPDVVGVVLMAGAVAGRLESIRRHGGITSREVAQLLDTTPQTVSRWRTGKVEPQSERLHRLLALEWLVSELSELYEPDEARLWLLSPHRLLGGDRPADRIQQGKGDEAQALVAQMRDGAFV